MITVVKKTGFDKVEIVVDNSSEINQLSTNYGVGSLAMCIEEKSFYILNGLKQWVKW